MGEQKSMESCTKMMFFVFKSFRRNNQSFVANLEVFQEKSFIILIMSKFSMESMIIGHEIHKKLVLSRCWDSNGNVNISQIEVTFIIENLSTKITYSRCLSQLCLSLCKKLKSFKEKKKSFVLKPFCYGLAVEKYQNGLFLSFVDPCLSEEENQVFHSPRNEICQPRKEGKRK